MLDIKNINFNEMKGNLTITRTAEEMQEIAELFKKKLKLNKYRYYVDLANDIHFSNKRYWIDITERIDNKFVVVKEDAYNNRQFSYYEILGVK